ncbi:MAG: hypothetical protein A3G45_01460 [Candidatus Staskawiczbacteria bacterium RIFCSPLOWO2_12_FULL_37_15]|uniref:Uncharacterized protein n=1 Tax=Candidatus Staskawiczbacteria bacterium RIFCSPLOWO2_12_FULL_37_15 TaxID=1802218 RepID=A0A1G2IR17_9BACT|nr:MAG: hypothetical protein A3G45_01460 [Candidatus Staskawiczbacteria bacterium RIFCSPLOWO2_12_FULL_37_15]
MKVDKLNNINKSAEKSVRPKVLGAKRDNQNSQSGFSSKKVRILSKRHRHEHFFKIFYSVFLFLCFADFLFCC